jgi:hypothetical protein
MMKIGSNREIRTHRFLVQSQKSLSRLDYVALWRTPIRFALTPLVSQTNMLTTTLWVRRINKYVVYKDFGGHPWSQRGDLNSRPMAYKATTLTTVLLWQSVLPTRFELMSMPSEGIVLNH